MPPDTEVELGVVRNGEPITLEVTMEERDAGSAESGPAEDPDDEDDVFERVGISVTTLDRMTRQNLRIEDDIDGVVVTRVRPLSPAGEEGMTPGLIITEANGARVNPPSDLRSVISEVDEGGYLRLYVYIPRADAYRFVILKLDD